MWTRRFEAILATTISIAAILVAAPALAEHPDRVTCQPIATCGDASTSPDSQECPDGHACVCVPSCPLCRDCATQVCVPAAIACHSACDCPDGMGCAGGVCREDAHPIHCCDDELCPAGERCQNGDGTIALCGRPNDCRTACDCRGGLACIDGECTAAIEPVYCCESDVCPAGEQCQSGRTGELGRCPERPIRECRTACDCPPGLGCFEGRCIAGFAPVFCCDGDVCPAGQQCQHRDGSMARCASRCIDHAWLCGEDDDGSRNCGDDRVCSCTASCPDCEDCGPNVCVPPGSPTPYRCEVDGSCARPGDQCICISSCPECDDCALQACVPNCESEDPMCRKRLALSQRRINRVVEKAGVCRADEDCVRVDTSTQCQGTCGAYVNRMFARRVQRFIDQVDERHCTGYQEAGCPFATPDCQETVGACVGGACVAAPASGPLTEALRLRRR